MSATLPECRCPDPAADPRGFCLRCGDRLCAADIESLLDSEDDHCEFCGRADCNCEAFDESGDVTP